jgi:hypothetical protein
MDVVEAIFQNQNVERLFGSLIYFVHGVALQGAARNKFKQSCPMTSRAETVLLFPFCLDVELRRGGKGFNAEK